MPQRSDFPQRPAKPKSTSTTRNGAAPRVEWKGYINVPLLEADKRHYHTWKNAPEVFDEVLVATLESGFKLSVDYQQNEAAYRASLYCQDAKRPEAGYCLSLFAGEPLEAVRRLLYVHAIKCQRSWSHWLDPRAAVDDWDDYS